jgi:hypothetical protein
VELARGIGEPALLAEALDAQLLVHWGPDDLADRLEITTQLEDVVAHLGDVEARMSAYLWRLTTAMECLDMPATRRQLRALTLLAEETGSPRIVFFARARQAMAALLDGEIDLAERLRIEAVAAGELAGEPDAFAIAHGLSGAVLRQSDDVDALRAEAELYEQYGVGEALLSVHAEAGQLWRIAGDLERAGRIAEQIGGAFDGIPRDLDWFLTVTMITDAAAAAGVDHVTRRCLEALTPYAGRGVVNGGGVSFHGVVDDYLAMACRSLGRDGEAAEWAASARRLHQRFGAPWWVSHPLVGEVESSTPKSGTAVLRRGTDGVWLVGSANVVVPVRDTRGLAYVHALLSRPGTSIGALELSGAGVVLDEPSAGPVLDAQALRAYRARLAEIDSELDEAEDWADAGRVARLRDERDALLHEVAAATGLGGRPRKVGSSVERARVAVRKAIAAAIERIAAVDPALGRHLEDSVKTGAACRYDPDPARPITWELGS